MCNFSLKPYGFKLWYLLWTIKRNLNISENICRDHNHNTGKIFMLLKRCHDTCQFETVYLNLWGFPVHLPPPFFFYQPTSTVLVNTSTNFLKYALNTTVFFGIITYKLKQEEAMNINGVLVIYCYLQCKSLTHK